LSNEKTRSAKKSGEGLSFQSKPVIAEHSGQMLVAEMEPSMMKSVLCQLSSTGSCVIFAHNESSPNGWPQRLGYDLHCSRSLPWRF
jgi:hypothetical protein